MATEMSKRVPQWRQGTLVKEALPLRLTPTARRIIFLIAVMGTLAGGIAGLVSWLQPLPNPYFMPFWVVEYRSPFLPLNTAADRDRIAIAGGNYFRRSSTAAVSSLDRHLMTHELAGLAGRSPSDSVVVYVCAYAGSDAQGVYIMPGDFDPDDPRSRIPLRELLGYLTACPANRQLLVLDIMWPVAEARLGILADEVAGCVKAELEQHPDARRLVLCAASASQVALRSEPLGRSAFGYYFEQALLGHADGFNSHNLRDGRVSVRELAAFVQARVGRWAWQARGKAQIPLLHGRGQDFELTAVSTSQLPGKSLDKPPEYPAWLLAAWKLRDQWQTEAINHRFPRVYRQLEAQVLRSEWQWRYGGEPSRMKSDLDARISQLQRRLRVADASLAAPTPRLLSIKLGHGQAPNAAAVAEIQALLDGLDPPDATLPPIAVQAKEIKLLQDFEQKTKDVDYPNLAEAAFEVIRQDGEPSAHAIRILDSVLRKRQPQCQFVETNFLHSLALLTERIPAAAWPASAAHRGLHAVDLCCRAAARARPFRWIEPWFTLAAGQQHQASMFLDAPGYAPLSEAENLFHQATARYEAVLAYQDLVGAAYYAFDDAGTFLPNSKNYLHANPSLAPIWWSACTAAKDLADVLEIDPPVNDRGALAKSIAKLRTRAGMLQTRLQMLGQPFAADRIAELMAQCKRAGTGPIVLTEVNAILETPILNAENRTALWSAVNELAVRLDSRVLALDTVDNQRETRETDVGAF
ncbi:MAG TPA: hypothetical protein VHY20_05945, partial [Pirellulales bacterium]|nr:hypothetical protein [Pirellulales bacterium]